MPSTKFNELLHRLQTTPWISPDKVSQVVKQLDSGKIPEDEAFKLLKALEKAPGINLFSEQMEDEWEELAKVIVEAENRIKKTNRVQLYLGLLGVPVYVAIIITCASLGWYSKEISTTFLTILISSLGAVVAYSFFIMRTQQQASIAIERLAEKRLAILFLKIAASSDQNNLNAEQLISAGTTMFMSHHAPETVPLSAEDLAASKPK